METNVDVDEEALYLARDLKAVQWLKGRWGVVKGRVIKVAPSRDESLGGV